MNPMAPPASWTSFISCSAACSWSVDFAESLQAMGESGLTLSTSAEVPSKKRSLDAVRTAVQAVSAALADLPESNEEQLDLLTRALEAVRGTLDYETRTDHRLSWTCCRWC